MRSRWTLVTCCILGAALGPSPAALAKTGKRAAGEQPPAFDAALFQGLSWREVGPYRGGRSAAVTGIPNDPLTYYFGSTGGGVWKTTDGGAHWKNVSDGAFGGSIGAVAVSAWDPNVVYVGGGEVTVRGNVSHGGGIWRSTDAGASWHHVGLADSRHVPRIRVHPRNPNLVYAAALGHLYGPSDERGVYRSKDGGATWERVLFANRDAGAVDLALDPTNPRILYASTWRVRRTPWSLESGGEGSALWKSTDGGDSWSDLSSKEGMPKGTLGIIGVTVSPSDPQNLYAVVEAEEGGVFRSRDGGETWTRTSDDRSLRQRAWYYSRVVADPTDADTVYVLNVRFWKSKDGGKTFEAIDVPHGDNHDLWIAPEDPLRMIESNDGGANVSFDGGATWSGQDNQPTAQFYRVSTDNDFPYRVLGAQQDNSAVRLRHRSDGYGIGERDWEPTAGGESGHIVADPRNPDVVYGGSYGGFLMRLDHATNETRSIDPWPDNPMGWGAAELRYRFQWNFPILFSPHDPRVLYAAANVLFRSTDEGESWEAISPDLTRNDKSTMGPSGGPITKDNTSVEYYGTIFAVAESPVEPGVLWTGSDDGLVHLSRDGGASWKEVTPPGMPDWIQINSIEPHPSEPGGLYVAASAYKSDDFHPYLYRTTDWGASWTKIVAGIPEDQFTRVVRADPERPGLLFAGTEQGIYVSFDDGGRWQSLQLKLPMVPITDLAVKDGDLIAATQGRGFWILDDVSPLRQLEAGAASAPLLLFRPRAAWRLEGRGQEPPSGRGANPPAGATVDFLLGEQLADGTEVDLELLTSDGQLVRKFAGTLKATAEADEEESATQAEREAAAAPEPEESATEESGAGEKKESKDETVGELEVVRGHNRFAWDLRFPGPMGFDGLVLWGGLPDGPRVSPGTYRARLTAGEQTATVSFEVRADPRSEAAPDALAAQLDFLRGVNDELTEVHRQIKRVRAVRAQIDDLLERLGDAEGTAPVREAAKQLEESMRGAEEALYQTRNRSRQDPLNYPIRLNNKLSLLARTVALGDNAPTTQAVAVRAELEAAIDAELAKLETVWSEDLPAFNRLVRETDVPAVAFEEDEQ